MATQGCDQSADSAAGMARGGVAAPQAGLLFWRESDKSQGHGDGVPILGDFFLTKQRRPWCASSLGRT